MRLLAVIFVLLYAGSFAQTGNYFLSHHAPPNEHFANVCFDIAQDQKGLIYFATKAGILQFDGRHWDLLKRKSSVYSIQILQSGEVYWSGADGYGKIGTDAFGFQEIQPLNDSTNSHVFQTYALQEAVYFLSDESIHVFNRLTRRTEVIRATAETGAFARIFDLYGILYLNCENGIFRITDGKPVHSRLPFSGDVAFVSRIENVYVIGTTDNKVYSCTETLQFTPVPIEDQEYADASVIISGTWINPRLLALGTLRGGVMFVNPITGKTEEIINYSTGLPDNEVFALMADHHENVWVAHDYGFTRVSPYMPFRSFNYYPGLQGNLLCAFSSQGSAYVGTSLGLFKLEKEDVYEELVYFVDVEIPQAGEKAKESGLVPAQPVIETPQTGSKRGGLFSFLKRKRNRNKENNVTAKTPAAEESASATPTVPGPAPRFRKEKRTRKVFRSSQFVYKKINGIDAKVSHLAEVNGQLIASGLGGVYLVDGLSAKSLMQEPVHYLYASRNENILFASTYDDKVRALVLEGNAWVPVNLLDDIDDQINFIFEGGNRELWLCGTQKIYQFQITDYNVNPVATISLQNSDAKKTLGIAWDGRVVFANTDGFFVWEKMAGRLLRIDSLQSPSQYFANQGVMVYRDEHGWKQLGESESHANLRLLDLFGDLRFMTSDKTGNLWIISGSSELYKFFSDNITMDNDPFPLILKSITNKNQKAGTASSIHISEDKSAVTFEIIQADFVSPDAIEFRYQLKGMKEEWSEWSSHNNVIEFPYLPPGEYTLNVQGRNIFGKVTELDPVTFEVLPPYWKRSWFYAMEVGIIASLVLLSFRLNTRYRIVSRLLSLLTIILLIQFMQAFMNSWIPLEQESPVISFIIQVFIALLVLPVEGYLRKLMFQSLDSSSKFYKFIIARNDEELIEEKEPGELQPTDER